MQEFVTEREREFVTGACTMQTYQSVDTHAEQDNNECLLLYSFTEGVRMHTYTYKDLELQRCKRPRQTWVQVLQGCACAHVQT